MDTKFVMNFFGSNLIFFFFNCKAIQCSSAGQNPVLEGRIQRKLLDRQETWDAKPSAGLSIQPLLRFPPVLENGKQGLSLPAPRPLSHLLSLPGSDPLMVFSFLAIPDPALPATNCLSMFLILWIKKYPVQTTDAWLQLAEGGKWSSWLPGPASPQFFDLTAWDFRALVSSTVSS